MKLVDCTINEILKRISLSSPSLSLSLSSCCMVHHAAIRQIRVSELLYGSGAVERFLFESYDILASGISSPNQGADIKKLWDRNIRIYIPIYM